MFSVISLFINTRMKLNRNNDNLDTCMALEFACACAQINCFNLSLK